MKAYKIRAIKHSCRHRVGDDDVTDFVSAIQIYEENGLFCLVRLDCDGKALTDTVHVSLNEAVRQAKFEYDVDLDLIQSE